MITCQLCKKQMKGLTLHLLKRHKLTPKEYLIQFPGEKIFCDKVLKSANFGGRAMRGKKVLAPRTAETRKKLSDKRKLVVGWAHSEATRAKLRAAAQDPDVRLARASGMKRALERDPTIRARLSELAKQRIAVNGLYFKRGKVTKLEREVGDLLTTLGLTYVREKRSSRPLLGAHRFFDFYVPQLGLLIEADGEFWHQREDRIRIDTLKERYALAEGYNFLRVSDLDSVELVREVLTERSWSSHTAFVIQRRLALMGHEGELLREQS